MNLTLVEHIGHFRPWNNQQILIFITTFRGFFVMAQIDGTSSDETLPGTADADTINGFNGNDSISGLGGDDSLVPGGGANDTVEGGPGNDTIDLGAISGTFTPVEIYDGGADTDELRAHLTNDTLNLTLATLIDIENIFITGSSNRTLVLTAAQLAGLSRIEGATQIQVQGGGIVDLSGLVAVDPGGLAAPIVFDSADQTIIPGLNDLNVNGGTGNDTADISGIAFPVTVNPNGTVTFTDGGGTPVTLTFINIDTITEGNPAQTIDGTGGDDNLSGTEDGDIINGFAGNDVIGGRRGADTIVAGPDSVGGGTLDRDSVDGGPGTDSISGGAGPDSLIGDDGNASVGENDTLIGGTGNDTLLGNGGDDDLIGGDDDDSLLGEDGNDSISGGDGADVANGGNGRDTIDGGIGNDTIDGGNDADSIIGGDGDDFISLLNGDDTAQGGIGNDSIRISEFNIRVEAGQGNDTIDFRTSAGNGSPTLLGGAGDDFIETTSRPDSISGGEDNDQISASGFGGADTLDGGDGNDTIAFYTNVTSTVIGGSGDDSIINGFNASTGAVSVNGGTGNDTIGGTNADDTLLGEADDDLISPDQGSDSVNAGTGTDTVVLDGDRADFIVTRLNAANVDSLLVVDVARPEDRDTINNAEVLRFNDQDFVPSTANTGPVQTAGNTGETLTGTAFDDALNGGTGNDSLSGLAGSDLIEGGDGDDTGLGGDNSDVLIGGAGADNLDGGTGNDLLRGDTGETSTGGNDTLLGQAGDDTLTGNGGNDSLVGGEDNDVLSGQDGNDTLEGGDGADNLAGGAGDDSLIGGSGNDTINTNGGLDTVRGGDGDDFLQVFTATPAVVEGGNDNDSIRFAEFTYRIDGGDGNDTLDFWSSAGSGSPTLDGGAGDDRIESTSRPDLIRGGDDNDIIVASGFGGSDTLEGGDGNDTIQHYSNVTITVSGGAGDDVITNGFGSSSGGADIDGGTGNDSLEGTSGDDTITGGADNDTIDGGVGNDTVVFSGTIADYTIEEGVVSGFVRITDNRTGSPDGVDLVVAVETAEFADGTVTLNPNPASFLTGTEGDDSLLGTLDTEVIEGLGGNDTLYGSTDGADTLRGGEGNDTLRYAERDVLLQGGPGDDFIDFFTGAGSGSPTLEGGAGNDTIETSSRSDSISGGDDDDDIRAAGFGGNDIIDGGDGNDTIDLFGTNVTVTGGAGNDFVDFVGSTSSADINGGTGNDTLEGTNGTDTIEGGDNDDLITPNLGNDSVDGGSGTDTVAFSGDRADFIISRVNAGTVDTLIVTDVTTLSNQDTLINVELLRFDDQDFVPTLANTGLVQTAGDAGETLTGTALDDVLIGGMGNDSISGLASNDRLRGGDGNDTVEGGSGRDVIDGSTGQDDLSGGDGDDSLEGDDGDLVLGEADTLRGEDGNDLLFGNGGNDSLLGGNDEDELFGQGGDDTLEGGDGNDTLDGGEGVDSLLGGAGNDRITAISGDDTVVNGGADNDTIRFAEFSVLIEGGDGNDFLDFLSGAGSGSPTLDGGMGNDTIETTSRSDLIIGGGGDDDLRASGYGGSDTLNAGDGNDTLDLYSPGRVTALAGDGDDFVDYVFTASGADVDGGIGNDTIEGTPQDDVLQGGGDDDLITPGGDDDQIDGGSGNDTIIYSGNRSEYSVSGTPSGLVIVDLRANSPEGSDTITNAEFIRFADGDLPVSSGFAGLLINGTGDDDNGEPGEQPILVGTILNDTINGLAGNDRLEGLAGFDILNGDGDDDTLVGGDGDDVLDGGAGDNDVAEFTGQRSDYQVTTVGSTTTVIDQNLLDGNDGTDTLTNIRILRFADQDLPLINSAPALGNDTAMINEDVRIDIPLATLLSNDSDADGDPLTITGVSGATNGTATLVSNSVRFDPTTNFNGIASFDYTVTDGFVSSTATVSITVNSVNDRPVAGDDTVSTPEDTSVVTPDLRGNDTDVDGDSLTITTTTVTTAQGGSASHNGDGTFTYTPAANFSGTDSFIYFVSDGNGETDSALVTVTVTAVNDNPVAVDDGVTTTENMAVSTPVLTANDTDADGDSLTVIGFDSVSANGGMITDNLDGTYTYTPASNFGGDDSFTYTVSDGNGGTDTGTVTITVESVNAAPTAGDDTAGTMEDMAVVTPNVLSNDTDPDGDSLSVSGFDSVSAEGGSVSDNGNGTFTYTPAANFSGTDSFTYVASDGRGGSDSATVTVTVTGVNDNPVTMNDTLAATEETAATTGNVLDNDSDIEGDGLTVVGADSLSAQGGTVINNGDGTFTYTPATDFSGTDSFDYLAGDGNGGSSTGTVNVTVTGENDDPVAVDDSAVTDLNMAVTTGNVLINDTDVDGDSLSVSGADTVSANGGTVVDNTDGTFTYTPAAGFTGTDSFTYTVDDGNGGSATATVTITVNDANIAPNAVNDTLTLNEDVSTVTGDLLANDTDANSDSLSIVGFDSVTGQGGIITTAAGNSLRYTPAANFTGSDSFTYTVSDGRGGTDTATVSVTVTPVNDAPVAVDDTVSAVEDTAVITPVLAVNDTDVEGDSLSVTGFDAVSAQGGTVTDNNDGTFTYTPAADVTGSDSFTYVVSDGNGGSDTGTVNITVSAVNDAPVANVDLVATLQDVALLVPGLLGNDTDVDGDSLTISAFDTTTAQGGTVAASGGNNLTYTPAVGFTGTDSFTYTASDGNGGTDTATVLVTVSPVQGLPNLSIANVVLPGGVEEEQVTISYDLINNGTEDAQGGFITRLYFSEDTILDSGDELERTLTFSADLPAGTTIARTSQISLPENPGDIFLLVQVDPLNFVAEGSELDNVGVSPAAVVSPEYDADVTTAPVTAPNSLPVIIEGVATDLQTGLGAAFEFVTIEAENNGVTRTFSAQTDSLGRWSFTYSPQPTEAGPVNFTARNPGVPGEDTAPEQTTDLFGAEFAETSVSGSVIEGSSQTFTVTLENLAGVDLSNLSVTLIGVNPIIDVEVDAPTSLAGNSAANVLVDVTVPDNPGIFFDSFGLQITSGEGALAEVAFNLNIIDNIPVLSFSEVPLRSGMLLGDQTLIDVEVTNTGGDDTGEIDISLPTGPDFSFLTLASPDVIENLGPGESTTVTLSLMPEEDLPIQLYTGNLAFNTPFTAASLPFSFNPVSSETGNLTLNITDELFYFAEGMPKLDDARVVIRENLTKEIVFQDNDVDGMAMIEDLPAGFYDISVQADEHDGFLRTIEIKPGETTELEAFLPIQAISYEFTVREIELTEEFDVTVEATFNTVVPHPAVLVEPSVIDLAGLDMIGDSKVVDLVLTNIGLIQTENVMLNLGSHPYYRIEPAVDKLDILDARSSASIPVTITRIGDGPPNSAPCSLGGNVSYSYDAGPNDVTRAVPIGYVNLDAECISPQGQPVPTIFGPGAFADIGSGPSAGSTGTTFPPVIINTQSDVPVQVRISIDQRAVLTRQGFEGFLELENGSDSDLTNIEVTIEIYDENGVLVGEGIFGVTDPELEGITAADGTGVLAADSEGSALFTIIPSADAAPTEPENYTIAGTLKYTLDGNNVTQPLAGDTVEVLPTAELELDYFFQRDVASDDPFTPEIEQAVPFDLGLLIQNEGAGTAGDLTITSAQPEIIENESGLLIDFEILGTEVNSQPIQPTLTADIGDLEGGENAVVVFQLESSLQGSFSDYEASFEAVNDLGFPELSTITSVEIRELIQVVRDDRSGADGLDDFLVNEMMDENITPDILYLSDGTTEAVSVATATLIDSDASDGQISVQINQETGWNYAVFDDPGMGDFVIDSVTRADGSPLPGRNAWQTDRTFPFDQTQRPVYEDKIHLFDFTGASGTDVYTINFASTAANTPPDARDDSRTTDEDTAISGNVLLNNGAGADLDADGDSLTVTEVQGISGFVGSMATLASGAQVMVNADGSFDYDPNGAFESLNGGDTDTDSFTYTISDGRGGTDMATVTVTINGLTDMPPVDDPNTPPDARDDAFMVGEDNVLSDQLFPDNGSGADTDADGDPLSIIEVNSTPGVIGSFFNLPSGAQVVVGSNSTFTYLTNGAFESLNTGETATDSFTYTLSDGEGGTDIATVTVTINGETDFAPDAKDDAFTVGEDQITANNVFQDNGNGRDSDGDGDPITVIAVNGNGAVVGQTITIPSGARLTLGPTGTFTYDTNGAFESLNTGETATDSFTYTISDGNGGTDTATATVTINGETDFPPDAKDDAFTVGEDQITANNVFQDNGNGRDSDGDGDPITVIAVNGNGAVVGQTITIPSGARLTLGPTGTFTYDTNGAFESLNTGETATDSFTYTISDGNGGTDTANVVVTIEGVTDGTVNTAPIGEDDSFVSDVTIEDVVGNVLADNGSGADSDPDGDPLTVTAVNGQAASVGAQVTLTNGSLLTVEADGSFLLIYDPAFDGLAPTDSVAESFTYTVEDGQGGSDTAMVSVTVNGLPAGGILGTSVDDTLDGDAGRDTIVGLSGNDLIRAAGARDILFGGRDDDTLLGQDGLDTLNGGSGNDSLNGNANDDTVNGGPGDDTIQISNGIGFDNIDGGDGLDVLQASRSNLTLGLSGLVNVETIDAMGFSNVRIIGSNAPDDLDFSTVTLIGITSISGMSGRDTIIGSMGNDNIVGEGGFDSLVGGDGDDTLEGANGNDTVDGGIGNDLILYDGQSTGRDVVDGGMGNDTISALKDNTVIGLASVENVETISGNGFANVQIIGSNAPDDLDFSTVTLIGITSISGMSGRDTIIGSMGNDNIVGEGGFDSLVGGDGDDTLEGANGNDTVDGGIGNDLILYDGQSTGRDVVDGGMGNDTISALKDNTVIGLASVENVETISGNGFANVRIIGNQAQNTLDFSGVTVTDIAFIDGSGGRDMLIGSSGNDDLRGGSGADTLSGGAGNDTLTGGGGADLFVIGDGFNDDTIVDFDPVRERLDVSGVSDVTMFDDLDTTGDGLVTDADALASSTVDGLVLTFSSASVLVENVTSLDEDNFVI